MRRPFLRGAHARPHRTASGRDAAARASRSTSCWESLSWGSRSLPFGSVRP